MRIHPEGYKLIPLCTVVIAGLLALLCWLIPNAIIQYALAGAALVL
jgi:hypothetical protein